MTQKLELIKNKIMKKTAEYEAQMDFDSELLEFHALKSENEKMRDKFMILIKEKEVIKHQMKQLRSNTIGDNLKKE